MYSIKGNYNRLALTGGIISIDIEWNCNLDWDFNKFCLPKYSFHILNDGGWNFRHAMYHEENKRTLFKRYGLRFILNVRGTAGKFDLTKSVIIVVTGIGLMGLARVVCDLLLLNCSSDFRKQVMEKKYEPIHPVLSEPTLQHLKDLLEQKHHPNDGMRSLSAIASIAVLPNEK